MNLFSLVLGSISSLKVKGFRLLSFELRSFSPGFLVFTIITLMKQTIMSVLSSSAQNVCWRVQDCKICFLAARKEINENITLITPIPDLFNASSKLNAYK